jgi:LPXTG-motif cell wall-anchored protein
MGTQITNTTPPDEVEAIEVLPFTGSEGAGLLMLAASAIMLGGGFLISARREEG